MMVLEVLLQHAENTLILGTTQNPESFAVIPGGTLIGPVVGVRTHYFLVIMELKSQFHLRIDKNEHLGW